MSEYFEARGVTYELYPFAANYALGIASFENSPNLLRNAVAETETSIAIGDVTLYDEQSVKERQGERQNNQAQLQRVNDASDDTEALARLNGDFAVAVYNKKSKSLALIRDHLGILPLHYSFSGDVCAFGTLVRPLLAVPWASRALDKAGLASFLINHDSGVERTFFQSVRRLRAATVLTLSPGIDPRNKKYWRPRPAHIPRPKTRQDAYDLMKDELTRSVLARAGSDETTGVKLSGGLDSSSIAGVACSYCPEITIQAVTSALPAGVHSPVGDEREFVEAMRQHYSNLAIHLETAENADVLGGSADWHDWQASPVADPFFYHDERLTQRLAGLGSRTILDGEGGDYCFSMTAEAYLAESIFNLSLTSAFKEFRRLQHIQQTDVLQTIRLNALPYLLYPTILRAIRTWRRGPWTASFALDPNILENKEINAYFGTCGYGSVESSPGVGVSRHEAAELECLDNGSMAYIRVQDSLYGVRTRFPLLDRQLLECCLAIPSEFKVEGNLDRALIRGAARKFLPNVIERRDDKGWFSPDFVERLSARKRDLHSFFTDPVNKRAAEDVVDLPSVLKALELLDKPASHSFNSKLLTHIVWPYHLMNFMASES